MEQQCVKDGGPSRSDTRASKACATCRRLKCRCLGDGINPCPACTVRGIECIYLGSKKRGPKFRIGQPPSDGSDGAPQSTAPPASKRVRGAPGTSATGSAASYSTNASDSYTSTGSGSSSSVATLLPLATSPQSHAPSIFLPLEREPRIADQAAEVRFFRLFSLNSNQQLPFVCKSLHSYYNQLKMGNISFLVAAFGHRRPVCDHSRGKCAELAFVDLQVPAASNENSSSAAAAAGSTSRSAAAAAAISDIDDDHDAASSVSHGEHDGSEPSENDEAAGVAALEALLQAPVLNKSSSSSSSLSGAALFGGAAGDHDEMQGADDEPLGEGTNESQRQQELALAHMAQLPPQHRTAEATSFNVLQAAKAVHYGMLALGARADGKPDLADAYILRCRSMVATLWDSDDPHVTGNLVSALLILTHYSLGILRMYRTAVNIQPAPLAALGIPSSYIVVAQAMAAALTIDGKAEVSSPVSSSAANSSSLSSQSLLSSSSAAAAGAVPSRNVSSSGSTASSSSSTSGSRLSSCAPAAGDKLSPAVAMTIRELLHLVTVTLNQTPRGGATSSFSPAAALSSLGPAALAGVDALTPRARVFQLMSHVSASTARGLRTADEMAEQLRPQATVLLAEIDEAERLVQQHKVGRPLSFALLAAAAAQRCALYFACGFLQPAIAAAEKAVALMDNPL